jgi:hypothetical protein
MAGKTLTGPVPFDPLAACTFFQAFRRDDGAAAQKYDPGNEECR